MRGNLSEYFGPFLQYFVQESQRSGGQAWVLADGPEHEGLLIIDASERVGTVFTRSPRAALRLSEEARGVSLFSELSLDRPGETFHIYAQRLPRASAGHRFRHEVRPYSATDTEAVLELLREVHGPVDARWLRNDLPREERGYVVKESGGVVGTGWVSVVNGCARLHSLAVRAPLRGLGIGTDLWHARILAAESAGATTALSEISERNLPSVRVAIRGGMRPVGRMYRYDPK